MNVAVDDADAGSAFGALAACMLCVDVHPRGSWRAGH
jgi:hypothetical protein